MNIGIVSLFPEMFSALRTGGVTARALERELITCEIWNPRDYADNRHRTVDDRPYGGGPGMVLQVAPVRGALGAARSCLGDAPVVYLSPQGKRLDQPRVRQLAAQGRMILLCGRYEGIDERLIELEVDEELSLGDYVLSGGELAAMVLIDAVARLQPDALGHAESACGDSFESGLLDHPHYTRPEEIDGLSVPKVLLGGNHRAVRQWRMEEALRRTWMRRPDLLTGLELDEEQAAYLKRLQKHG